MSPTAWLAEEDEQDEKVPGDTFLLGTFYGHVDDGQRMVAECSGLSVEAAIAWGRERAPHVYIRLGDGDEYFSAGEKGHGGFERWPPPALPSLVRRRPAWDAWKDRPASAPAVAWEVQVEVLASPWPDEGFLAGDRDRVLGDIAAATPGARDVRRSDPHVEGEAWCGESSHVTVEVEAPNREEAVRVARARCAEPPDGWRVAIELFNVRPSDP